MSYAYPSPATQKPNGHVDKDKERVLGMTLRERYLVACLEGFAAALVEMEKPLTPDEIELIAQQCLALVERLEA